MRRILVFAGAAVLLIAACSGPGTQNASDDGAEENDSVLFEPASSKGPDPFTETVVTTSVTPEQVEGLDASPGSGVVFAGNGTGLYGGTGDQTVCDAAKLKGFLEENPDKAAAWAAVEGIETADISVYVDGLSPILLLNDTRVTNHGYADGLATPRQSTLEAGTAVLVDQFGVPRARCACGNPLLEPEPGDDDADGIAIVPGPSHETPPTVDVDTGAEIPAPPATSEADFCDIYAAMRADLGSGPSGPSEIDAWVARAADWLSQLITIAQATPDFPPGGLADMIAYQEDLAAGPGGGGDPVLRDMVEEFLESYCSNPPPPVQGPEPEPYDPGPVPDTNCGSFQFFLLVETAESLGLDWEPVGGSYFEQLTNFEADSLDDMLTYEDIGCEGAQAMIELLEANGIPNPFA